MPVSTTTRGRPMSRDRDMGRIAFCRTESIGAPKLVFAAQWLACTIPVNASLRPSRVAAHDSGSVWLATPSPQRTFTSYLLPVSRRTRPPHQQRVGN